MHNVVGVIPAAGEARRMRPYSLAVPKQLMPYGHKPAIHHILEMFRESGVNETVIIVSDTTSPIRTYVGDGSWLGVDVSYAMQREPLGVAHALICGYDVLTQDLEAEAIVHVNGDRVVSPASILQDLIGDHSQQDALSTFLVSRISDPSSYGALEVDSRTMRVHRIVEKPTQAQQQGLELPDGGFLATTGVYVHSLRLLEFLSEVKFGPEQPKNQLVKAYNRAISKGEMVKAAHLDCEIRDFGTPENYLSAQWNFFRSLTEKQVAELSVDWRKLATEHD